MKKVVVGIVENRTDAEVILFNLRNAGIRPDDVSGLFPGVGAGGVLGGTLGLLAGIGTLAIPGFGPLIAAGPLMAALGGAAAGAAVGGVTGALVGLGLAEIEATHYEGKVKGGKILIAVHAETSDVQKTAEGVLKRAGAHDISATSEASVPNAPPSRPLP